MLFFRLSFPIFSLQNLYQYWYGTRTMWFCCFYLNHAHSNPIQARITELKPIFVTVFFWLVILLLPMLFNSLFSDVVRGFFPYTHTHYSFFGQFSGSTNYHEGYFSSMVYTTNNFSLNVVLSTISISDLQSSSNISSAPAAQIHFI